MLPVVTSSVLERAKTVYASDRAATVIGVYWISNLRKRPRPNKRAVKANKEGEYGTMNVSLKQMTNEDMMVLVKMLRQ
jgi:hypothetical protein